MRRGFIFALSLLILIPLSGLPITAMTSDVRAVSPEEDCSSSGVGACAVTYPPPPLAFQAIKNMTNSVSGTNILQSLNTLQGFGSRWYEAAGNAQAAQWLHDSHPGSARVVATYHTVTIGSNTYKSVILTLPGLNVSSNRTIYRTSHFDACNWDDSGANITINSPGADDDGSSVASALEELRILSQYNFEYTIKFAFFNLEESGRRGSQPYIEDMLAQGQNMSGAITSDMIGYGTGTQPNDLYLGYNVSNPGTAAYLLDVNTRYQIGLRILPYQSASYERTDAQQFWDHGIYGVIFHEYEDNPYYHSAGDRVSTLNVSLISKFAKLTTAALASAAGLLYTDPRIDETGLSLSNQSPIAGEPVTVNVTVTNPGTMSAPDLELELRADGTRFTTFSMWVPAEGSNTTSVNWTPGAGNHTITAVLDPKNVLLEVDETNNQMNISVSVNDRPLAVLLAAPASPLTHVAVLFDGSSSSDILGGVTDFSFDFGDGNGTGWVPTSTISHAYAQDGNYTATLMVRDALGAVSAPSDVKIRVLNRAPLASPFTDVVTALTMVPIMFYSNASDEDGTYSVFWDMGDGYTTTESDPIYAYPKSGDYSVALEITDDDGASGSFSISVNIEDRPPECSIEVPTAVGNISQRFSFTAAASDPDGMVVSYSWDFGDGSDDDGETVDHVYAKPGNYSVTLAVLDDNGSGAIASVDITVVDTPPVAAAGCEPCESDVNKKVRFSSEGSGDLEGKVGYSWDFGDGVTSNEMSPEHVYEHSGRYTVILTIRDEAGQDMSATIIVDINNNLPEARFGVSGSLVKDGKIHFDASNSSDPDGPVMYMWDFGDGKTGSGAIVEHAYIKAGDFMVTLTVTDQEGAEDTMTMKVKIAGPSAQGKDGIGPTGNLLVIAAIALIIVAILAVLMISHRFRPKKSGKG